MKKKKKQEKEAKYFELLKSISKAEVDSSKAVSLFNPPWLSGPRVLEHVPSQREPRGSLISYPIKNSCIQLIIFKCISHRWKSTRLLNAMQANYKFLTASSSKQAEPAWNLMGKQGASK